jgi:hypothetical protein
VERVDLLLRNLREYAESKFKRDGVKVKGNSKITAVGPDWLELEGEGRGQSRLSTPESMRLRISTVRTTGLVNRIVPESIHRQAIRCIER